MRKSLTALFGLFTFLCANAQQTVDIDLWQNGLPNSNGIDKTSEYNDATRNFKPSIKVFLPAKEKSNNMAVICCPGGGYTHLALQHEGYDWAPFFNDLGFTFVVLKYRMPHGVTEVPISDAKEALRLVREKATEWNINPDKVGIMGSSAGGHLATTVATHSEAGKAPNFQILFYPVVTFSDLNTHKGSRNALIGDKPTYEQICLYSNEQQVSSNTPPAILLLSDDDGAVPSQNSVDYYLALRRHGVKATMHIYPSGGHGWGYKESFRHRTEMLAELKSWLKSLK